MDNFKIVMKHIDELVPYAGNPRDNDDSVDFVANSIQQFGFKVPNVIKSDGTLATGHTRLKAVRKLVEKYGYDVPMVDGKGNPTGKTINLSVIPCVLADDLTDDQIRAFRIADNKAGEASTWNLPKLDLEMLELPTFDMSLFGFPTDEVRKEAKKSGGTGMETMELRAFEHHDYLVFVFDNQMDWLNAVNAFGIHKVNAGYGTTKKVGVGRVVDGKRLLERIQYTAPDTEPGPQSDDHDNGNPA